MLLLLFEGALANVNKVSTLRLRKVNEAQYRLPKEIQEITRRNARRENKIHCCKVRR